MAARVALHARDAETRLALARAFEAAPRSWNVFLWDGEASFDVLVTDSPTSKDAVRFDARAPERSLADAADALQSSSARVTVFTGPRRGCGVSTLALHVAGALAPAGDVCFLDLDPTSSLRARLGLPDDSRDWTDADDGVLAAAIPLAPGFRMLLAPREGRGRAADVLRSAAARFAHVVVDAPASPGGGLALARASCAVLAIPPSRQGIVYARDLLARYDQVRWSCVVNRLGAGGELTARHVARELGRPVTLEFPCSPYLRDREDDRRLLTARWSRYFRRATRLAAAIA